MTRTMGLCAAAALGFAVSLGAQTTTTAPNQTTTSRDMRSNASHEVTVTGCLARGTDGNFMLNNAHVDDAMSNRSRTSSNPTTTTASGATTTEPSRVGTTGSNPTSTTAGGAATSAEPYGKESNAANAMSWTLVGGKDLDKHVGHKVQVTGHTENGSSSSSMTSTGTTASSSPTTSSTGTTTGHETTGAQHERDMTHGARLDVTSVKMISSSCQ